MPLPSSTKVVICEQSILIKSFQHSWVKKSLQNWIKVPVITRQVYNLFQDMLNWSPYFEGFGVGIRSLGAKAVQTYRQTDMSGIPLSRQETHLWAKKLSGKGTF